jgi:hypothetical protein
MQSPQIVNVFPSDALLVDPCKAQPAGESLIELAQAYNKNTSCIGLFHLQMNKFRENKAAQEALYHGK